MFTMWQWWSSRSSSAAVVPEDFPLLEPLVRVSTVDARSTLDELEEQRRPVPVTGR